MEDERNSSRHPKGDDMNYIKKPEWSMPEREATPESVFLNRRSFMAGGVGLMMSQMVTPPYWPERDGPLAMAQAKKGGANPKDQTVGLYPAQRNPKFALDRPLTEEKVAAEYNNFYEFGGSKAISWLAKRMETRPWQVEVTGHVKKPKTYDIDELIKGMTLEERLYRFRCVEAWAMAVPWTGFRISELIKKVEPTSKAKYIKFTTFLNRKVALGQLQVWYPWPYVEGLTMKEAMNDLAMMGTGIYGHPLPQQHGAPLRLVVPWKFGFKSVKSIVSIEFTDKRPRTFWERAAPSEYGFWANINPKFNHPRWSQASERMLGTNERRPTLLFNGYAKWVGDMYPDMNDRKYFM